MRQKTRETLEQFVEDVRTIERESWVAFYNEGHSHLSISITAGQSVQVGFTSPPEEALRAVLIIVRQFTTNEPISFKHIPKLLSDPDLSSEFKERFTEVRTNLNGFLHWIPPISAQPAGNPLSHYRILDTFNNGHYFHKDAKHRALYLQIKNDVTMQWALRQTIERVLVAAFEVRRLMVRELEAQPQQACS
jgi:hypothetical protein